MYPVDVLLRTFVLYIHDYWFICRILEIWVNNVTIAANKRRVWHKHPAVIASELLTMDRILGQRHSYLPQLIKGLYILNGTDRFKIQMKKTESTPPDLHKLFYPAILVC